VRLLGVHPDEDAPAPTGGTRREQPRRGRLDAGVRLVADRFLPRLDDSQPRRLKANRPLRGAGRHRRQRAGTARGSGLVEADGRVPETERVLLASGSEPIIPPIEGLEETGYWTNREATTLSEIPKSAILIGAGPVGIELGQMLARFGSVVRLVDIFERPIPKEDPQVSALIAEALEEDGIRLLVRRKAVAVRREGNERVVRFEDGEEVRAEALVVSGGRRPRVGELGLETVGVEARPEGIAVDERCRAGEGIWVHSRAACEEIPPRSGLIP
jgi:dihydrolipoamide dehydrogenase